jgi:hypothetical protein
MDGGQCSICIALQGFGVLSRAEGHHCSSAHSILLRCHAGRILNIAVCAADTNEPPRLLNYLTAPNVVVWSAVACSSAFPGLFQPQDLLAKDHNGNFVR